MNQKTLLIAAGICSLTMSSHASLVAWYKFDEGAGASTAINSVSGSSNGTISTAGTGGSITTGVTGISGNAYQFAEGSTTTSGGFVDMGNANFFGSITTAQKVTISAWINTSDLTGQNNVAVFAGNNTSSTNYMDTGFSALGDGTRGIPAGGAYARDRATGNGITAPGTSAVNNGQWHLLVMTLDLTAASNQLNLYVDGTLSSSQTLTGGSLAFPTLNNFNVGRLGRSAPTDYYTGLIDDVQVYDSALSAGDVQFLFNNPGVAAVPEPGTLALAALGLGLFYFKSRRNRKHA